MKYLKDNWKSILGGFLIARGLWMISPAVCYLYVGILFIIIDYLDAAKKEVLKARDISKKCASVARSKCKANTVT